MKALFVTLMFSIFGMAATAQTGENGLAPDPAKELQTVEVSCGKCKLGLPGNSCDIAVRIGKKAYYADGASMDNYGDAHADDGMCNVIRQAQVQGELVGDRFKVSYIKLLPMEKKGKGKKQ